MTTGWILACIMMVVFGLLGLIGTLMRISEQEELDNMTNNELVELWSSQEMDNWLDELDEEDL